MLKPASLLDLSKTLAKDIFNGLDYPWEALPLISSFILDLGNSLSPDEFHRHENNVWIHKTAKIAPSAFIEGPAIIDSDTVLRHSAFIRPNAIIGKSAVIGNSVEIKNSIIFDCAQVPHFNYVGDSILGYKAHMGAGSITSNVKSDHSIIYVKYGEFKICTGLLKFGTVLADNVEIGCNAVLAPGSLVGRNSTVYPTSFVRGFVPENSILTNHGVLKEKTN
jgi:NDP-sugar pyrophosphorylase family protein